MLDLLRHWRSSGRPVIHVQHLSREADSVFWPGQSGWNFRSDFSRRTANG
jgi:hypothetical protein